VEVLEWNLIDQCCTAHTVPARIFLWLFQPVKKAGVGCWFVDGDNLTGDLHMLRPVRARGL